MPANKNINVNMHAYAPIGKCKIITKRIVFLGTLANADEAPAIRSMKLRAAPRGGTMSRCGARRA